MTAYKNAITLYKTFGVDVEDALLKAAKIPVSLHCWQGDDVRGFEGADTLSGGIAATGNYPGRARNFDELSMDLSVVLNLIPGSKRLNLHAVYAVTDKKVERDLLESKHFEAWIKFAKGYGLNGLDFNPTFFSHPMAASGLTLSSPDKNVRSFWIRHAKACRQIAMGFGKEFGTPSLHNMWIPDGFKDIPADRLGPRLHLKESLDEIYSVKYDRKYIIDSVESKVFGIGVEAYTVGSHEFYMNYAAKNNICCLLDNGHFHPTESVADKLSSLFAFSDFIALHITRPMRWDSDHAVLFEDEIKEIAKEIIRCGAEEKILIGLDYFDASINRLIAWAAGARNVQKALLYALLYPHAELKVMQDKGDFGKLLAWSEEIKMLPLGAVWDEYCRRQGVPCGTDWYTVIYEHEKKVTSRR